MLTSCHIKALLPMQTLSVGWVGSSSQFICLFICLSVYPQHNSKTNDPKVFKLDVGNDLGIYRVAH